MKYMVMETCDSYAVVLDSEGRFIKVANFRYIPGQILNDIFPMKEEEKKGTLIPWKKIMAAAACFIVMAVTIIGYISTPYASVIISINPSVQIDIDKNENVKKVVGANADGEKLVQGYNYKGKNLNTAVDELVDMAIDQGYLYDGGRITVTMEGDSRWIQTNEQVIGEHINQHMQQKMSVSIQVGESYASNTQVIVEVTDYGESDYGISSPDTDYGPGSDGDTDYTTADTDYGPGNDGVTDYNTPETDYNSDDGVTDYGNTTYSQSDYDSSASDYDD